MAERLLIGVTGPDHGIPWAWWATRWQLRRHGAQAVHLTTRARTFDERCAGVVIGGGNDIDPAIYGGNVSDSPNLDRDRDRFELEVLAEADRREIPVLGICRGAQLLNVHAGGSLVTDLKKVRVHTSNKGTLLPRKVVSVDESSVLAGWLGGTETRVNSLHNQAVDRTGENLRVTATDRDGIVQAIEYTDGPMRIGVQWHPEYMPQRQDQRRLFGGFVEACAARR